MVFVQGWASNNLALALPHSVSVYVLCPEIRAFRLESLVCTLISEKYMFRILIGRVWCVCACAAWFTHTDTHPAKIPQRNKMYIHNSIKILRFWAFHSSAWACGRVREETRPKAKKKKRQLSATILLQNNKAACVPYHDHFISVQCSLNINKTSFQQAKCKTEEKKTIHIHNTCIRK